MQKKNGTSATVRFASRGTIAAVITLLLLGSNMWAQAPWESTVPDSRKSNSKDRFSTSLRGTVVVGSQPAAGATVQLQDINTGMPVGSALTNAGGWFEIEGLHPGDYRLTVEYELQTADDRISIAPLQEEIQIRLPAEKSNSPTVSAAELKVPEKARHKLDQARQALAKNNTPSAEQKIDEALQIAPSFPAALTLRATLRLSSGKTPAAISDLDDAIRIDPAYPFAYFVLSSALNQMSRFTDAHRAADQGLRLDPRSWQGHYEAARSLLGQDQAAPALAELDHARETAPPNVPELHLLRGTTLLNLHRYEESARELEVYLKLEPQSPQSAQARQWLKQAEAQRVSTSSR